MARPSKYHRPRRVNILIEESIHEFATQRAHAARLAGGFSEYVARLITQDSKRKGRAIFSASCPSKAFRAA